MDYEESPEQKDIRIKGQQAENIPVAALWFGSSFFIIMFLVFLIYLIDIVKKRGKTDDYSEDYKINLYGTVVFGILSFLSVWFSTYYTKKWLTLETFLVSKQQQPK